MHSKWEGGGRSHGVCPWDLPEFLSACRWSEDALVSHKEDTVTLFLPLDDSSGPEERKSALMFLERWMHYHRRRSGWPSARPLAADFAFELLESDPYRHTFARVFLYTFHLQMTDLRAFLVRHLVQSINLPRRSARRAGFRRQPDRTQEERNAARVRQGGDAPG